MASILSKRNLRTVGLASSGSIWVLGVGLGFALLGSYENRPGEKGILQSSWPGDSQIPLDPRRPTLVMLAHPRCPCTRATINELAHIMTQCQGRVAAYVLFWKPSHFPAGWDQIDLWSSAADIPGVEVRCDEGGQEARRFGARTSGQVYLFHPDGQMIFRGGITGARGHIGSSPGREAVTSFLTDGTALIEQSPVYGCPLFDVDCPSLEDQP